MSANRDTSQKTTFVYSNLYQLYRKGKEAAEQAQTPAAEVPVSNPAVFQLPNQMGTLASEKNVLKTGDLKAEAAPSVSAYQPPSLLAKRIVDKPQALKQQSMPAQSAALESLKANLKSLNDLHSRLKFMLEELQELVKE
jgi:hypothetical protein